MRMVSLEGLQKDVEWVQTFLNHIEENGKHAPTDTMRRLGDGVAVLSAGAANQATMISCQVGYVDNSTETVVMSVDVVAAFHALRTTGADQPGWAVLAQSDRRKVVENYVMEQCHILRGWYPTWVSVGNESALMRPAASRPVATASFRAESAIDAFELIKACWANSIPVPSFRCELTGDVADVACEIVTNADLESLQRVAASVEDGHVMLETLRACAVADNSLERDPLVRARLFARERQSGVQDLPGVGF